MELRLKTISLNLMVFIIINCVILESQAQQPPDTIWTKTFGGSNIDIGHAVQPTTDGGYVITGYTRSFGTMSGRNVWLIKTDSFGNLIWQNTFGGNNDDEGHDVKQTSDGGYIISGLTESYGAGLKDIYLIKTDSLGNFQWERTFGGSNDDEGYSVLQTNDGGFLIAGVSSSFSNGGRDVFLVKTNDSGIPLWQRNLGGLSSDGAWEVQHTSDGGFIIAGWTFSHGPGFLGNAWLLKTDSLGNEQWNNAFGGTDADRAYSVQQTIDGGYVLTGYSGSFGAGLYDMLLIKTDSLGSQQWMQTFGGTGRDYGNSVQLTSDGGFIVAGYTLSFGAGNEDMFVVKTDANGDETWTQTYGGSSSDIAYSIKETTDGGFIIAGHTLSFGAGVHDVWLIRVDTVIPVELTSFTASENGNNVTLNWMTSSELNNLGFEIERSKMSEGSNWEKIGFVEGKGTKTGVSTYSYNDKRLTSGVYNYRIKQIDFDGTFKYYNLSESVEVGMPDRFELYQNYPNPFNPVTTFNYQLSKKSNISLIVYDVLGNEIAILDNGLKEAGFYSIDFYADFLPSGIYIYQLIAEEFKSTRKLILLK